MKYLFPFLLSLRLLAATSLSVTYDSVTKTVAPSNLVFIAPLTATVPTTGNSVVNKTALDAAVAAGGASKLDATNGVAYQSLSLIPANVTARTNIVQVAPYQSATYAAGDFGPTSGETSYEFLNIGNAQRLRQSGTVTRVKTSIASVTGVTGLYAKVWRKLASNNYTLVGTSENLLSQASAGSVNTLALATGITSQVGDYIGLRVTYSSASIQLLNSEAPVSTSSTIYTVSNSTPDPTAYAWESQTATANTCVVVETYMVAPILVGIGDSIMSGNSTTTSLFETNGTYVAGLDFPSRISTATGWSAQNMGYSAQRITSTIIARFTNDLINLAPRIALLEGGVNDLRDGTTVSAIMVTYNLMLSNCVTAGITPVVMGVMPFRTYAIGITDAMLTNRSSLNIQLQAAAVSAGGFYVDPDPYIGAFYGGGPENNRWMLTRNADAGDGLHLSSAGQASMVRAIFEAIAPLRVRGGIEAGYVTAGGINTKGPILFDTSVPHLISGLRQTNYAAAAQSLTLQAQSAPQNATNSAGGNLVLQPGTSTGTGGGTVYIQTPTPGSSGTNDAAQATRMTMDYTGIRGFMPNSAFGASASPDSRFGIYYRDTVGSGVDAVGIYSLPQIAANQTVRASAFVGGLVGSSTIKTGAGFRAATPTISSGSITNWYGVSIDTTSTATRTVGLYLKDGTESSLSQDWSIYSETTKPSYLAGALTVAGVLGAGNRAFFGAASSSDSRFGIYYRDTIGDGVNAAGVYSRPTFATDQTSSAGAFMAAPAIDGTVSQANGFYAHPPTIYSGALTNWSAFFADTTPAATYSSGVTISRGRPATLTRSYAVRSLETNQSYFAGPMFFAANSVAIGAYSSADDLRFGVYFYGPVGNGTDAAGINSRPYVTASQAARAVGINAGMQTDGTINRAAAFRAGTPAISSGAITNWFGVSVDTTSTATRTVGLFLGDGTEPALSQDWAIYSTSTKPSSFAGSVALVTGGNIGANGTAITRVRHGRASAMVGGVIAVADAYVTASTRIILTVYTPGGTRGFLDTGTRTASTSFTITSSSVLDTSVVDWVAFEP